MAQLSAAGATVGEAIPADRGSDRDSSLEASPDVGGLSPGGKSLESSNASGKKRE